MYHQMLRSSKNKTATNFKSINQIGAPVELKVYFIVLTTSFFKSRRPPHSETAKSIVDS